jgi:glycogen debranching enzyme
VSRQRIVAETVTTALEHGIALLEYRAEKIGRARNLRAAPAVSVSWTVDLRRMWPYPTASAGDLRFNLGADGRALVVCHADAAVTFAANRAVQWRTEPVRGMAAVRCTLSATLDEPLRIAVIAGTDDGDAHVALRRRGVTAVVAQRRRHEEQVRDYELRVLSPDPQVNTAVEWAKQRIDEFVVDTPGVGRSLVAGYAASRPGWGDGRPGYAWYFGRDACWTALAALAAGDFSLARLALRHLGHTQDVTGKVIHELTTSGLAHYDAADSTPLFLLLAGRYAAWTGDLPFLEERWPELERAYAFCLTTDHDRDGLIENAGVGHGWLEMGPLAGAKTSLYLASVWLAALESLAPVAQAVGKESLAAELTERATRARAAIATRFLVDGGVALGIEADGSPQRHRTALTAVPLLLGAVDASAAAAWLDAIARPEFSAPWGVRLLSTRDPLYNPAGYHTGAVWPLYTGWVSLAEYACHRGDAGGEHVLANARLPFARGVGMFDEVLRGDDGNVAGVCPDQAWSAAMLLAPLVEGMLGARPDALGERLTLAPHLPASWRECEWRNLHVGHTTLDVRVAAKPDRVELHVRRTGGRRLALIVAPAMPAGRVPSDATVDGERLAPRLSEPFGCRHGEVRLELSEEHVVEIWHRPG